MTIGEDWLLDTVAFDPMLPGLYARVHPAAIGSPPTLVDPRRANPCSKARLALGPHVVPGAPGLGMVYLSDTAAGALFEAILRHADWHGPKQLGVPSHRLAGQRLSLLRLRRELQVVPLGLPDRGRVITTPWRAARCTELTSTPDHADTHAAAAALHAQVTGSGSLYTGLTWGSVQHPSARIYLLYMPPFDPADWVVDETVALDTPDGERRIAEWLHVAGYTWVGDPAGVVPIPGAL